MTIYVLIILCLCLLGGIGKLIVSLEEDNGPKALYALFKIAALIIAIIFQSINL